MIPTIGYRLYYGDSDVGAVRFTKQWLAADEKTLAALLLRRGLSYNWGQPTTFPRVIAKRKNGRVTIAVSGPGLADSFNNSTGVV